MSTLLSIRAIVGMSLRLRGLDGLVEPTGQCSCGIDDLMPCNNPVAECMAAHLEEVVQKPIAAKFGGGLMRAAVFGTGDLDEG